MFDRDGDGRDVRGDDGAGGHGGDWISSQVDKYSEDRTCTCCVCKACDINTPQSTQETCDLCLRRQEATTRHHANTLCLAHAHRSHPPVCADRRSSAGGWLSAPFNQVTGSRSGRTALQPGGRSAATQRGTPRQSAPLAAGMPRSPAQRSAHPSPPPDHPSLALAAPARQRRRGVRPSAVGSMRLTLSALARKRRGVRQSAVGSPPLSTATPQPQQPSRRGSATCRGGTLRCRTAHPRCSGRFRICGRSAHLSRRGPGWCNCLGPNCAIDRSRHIAGPGPWRPRKTGLLEALLKLRISRSPTYSTTSRHSPKSQPCFPSLPQDTHFTHGPF